MISALYQRVRTRAAGRCEYCHAPERFAAIPFQIDHIIALKHDGPTEERNLALACFSYNNSKGTNIGGLDPQTGRLTRIFNPRRQRWERHFRWDGPLLVGLTAVGRTTIRVLEINNDGAIFVRAARIEEGLS